MFKFAKMIVAYWLVLFGLSHLDLTWSSRIYPFRSPIINLMDIVAKDYGFLTGSGNRNYDKAHIIPYDNIVNRVDSYGKPGSLTTLDMQKFIDHVTTPHEDATFYRDMTPDTRQQYNDIGNEYKENALSKFVTLNNLLIHSPTDVQRITTAKDQLNNILINSPFNLFPGRAKENRSIKNHFDPPTSKSDQSRMSLQARNILLSGLVTPKMDGNGRFFTSDVGGTVLAVKYQVNTRTTCNKKRRRRSLASPCLLALRRSSKQRLVGKTARKPKKKAPSRKTVPKGRTKGGKGGKGKGLKSGFIDLTGGWIPKHSEYSKSGKSTGSSAGGSVSQDGAQWSANSGGVKGEIKSGYSQASGQVQAGVKFNAGKEGVSVKLKGPSGQASSHGVSVGADLAVKAGTTFKDGGVKVGIEGPSANANIGPIGFGIGVGAGVDASSDIKKGAGVVVDTPKGSYGVKVGCISQICFIGCITLKLC